MTPGNLSAIRRRAGRKRAAMPDKGGKLKTTAWTLRQLRKAVRNE